MQSRVKLGMMTVKAIGKSIKKSVGMFSRNKNTVKNLAYGLQEKVLKTGLNFKSKSIKYLGGQTIKNSKYTIPRAATEGSQLFRAPNKQNIQTRSAAYMSEKGLKPMMKKTAEQMRGDEISSLLNTVAKSKLSMFTGGGLMAATGMNLVNQNNRGVMPGVKLEEKTGKGDPKILDVKARQVLDSRGMPTVEAEIITENGTFRAMVPSGASTGIYEALELRDEDKNAFGGKGVMKAVTNVRTVLKDYLVGKSCFDQAALDKHMVEEIDGSMNNYGWSKYLIGANSILPVSMALSRAGASHANKPLYRYLAGLSGRSYETMILPVPSANVINGGKHAGNGLAFQEFMVLPIGARSFTEAIQIIAETYQNLKTVIKKKYGNEATNVGDEGGFAPNIRDNREALDLIMEAVDRAGWSDKVKLGMDVAASEFYNHKKKVYDLDFKNPQNNGKHQIDSDQLKDLYVDQCREYPIASIEDPFEQDDFDGYTAMTEAVGKETQIVGDDLQVTNPKRIKMAMEKGACNALLLKVNQIGTLTESIDAANLSLENDWGVMVSHRSGETEDNFIADLAVGLGAGQIKTGAPCRSDRNSKYNQLLRIEEELGENALYAGSEFRHTKYLV